MTKHQVTPEEYLRRCDSVRSRGLCDELVHNLREAGDVGLLDEVEACTDQALARLNTLHRGRQPQPGDSEVCPRCGEPMSQPSPCYEVTLASCEHGARHADG